MKKIKTIQMPKIPIVASGMLYCQKGKEKKMPESIRYHVRRARLEHHEDVEYRVRFAGEYSGTLKQEILQFKFEGQKDLGQAFGERIYENLQKAYDLSDYDYLLPIPSRPSSLAERSYNPVRVICECLSELCGLPLVGGVLEALERPPQVGLQGNERRENMKGAFRLIDPSRVKENGFLVLDDVLTTGATLDEVIGTLNTAAPGQLDAVILARTIPPWEEI